ncbi:hypothetical protein ERY430_80127 [Erythrobacter sp. EC-HK427]|nr:hypothetical protein ERY430_80127 [Erythrobacter sp. EC-HK427]
MHNVRRQRGPEPVAAGFIGQNKCASHGIRLNAFVTISDISATAVSTDGTVCKALWVVAGETGWV